MTIDCRGVRLGGGIGAIFTVILVVIAVRKSMLPVIILNADDPIQEAVTRGAGKPVYGVIVTVVGSGDGGKLIGLSGGTVAAIGPGTGQLSRPGRHSEVSRAAMTGSIIVYIKSGRLLL